ncbi:MAG: zinc-binding alcohol dehydrogenase family protein [Actinomycetota bacterium]|nr:zinc-binding alcohol dehydrogenase family protein [Actinomycetota bacterium]
MLAAIVDAPGASPRVGDVDSPKRASGSTLLEVVAAPLNPLDLLIASGAFHSARHESAYVPGSECVGRVLESDSFEVGSLVYAESHASPTSPGSLSTHVVVPDADILSLPDGIDPIQAAAIGNSGVAAFLPLVDVARLSPGDVVLVLGATGSVGQLAVQIAHLRGASRVVGVGRDTEVLAGLAALGADAVVELRAGEDTDSLAERIRAATGPVDVVIDTLYSQPLEAALQTCAMHARVVNVGHSAGPTATIPAGLLRGKQIAVSGFAGLHTPLRDKQVALEWLWAELAAGRIHVPVTTLPLEDLPTAWSAQAMSPHAKHVVVPRPNESESA